MAPGDAADGADDAGFETASHSGHAAAPLEPTRTNPGSAVNLAACAENDSDMMKPSSTNAAQPLACGLGFTYVWVSSSCYILGSFLSLATALEV